MACQNCNGREVKSMTTREHPTYNWVRRRRMCADCGHRWWTVELAEDELSVDQSESDE